MKLNSRSFFKGGNAEGGDYYEYLAGLSDSTLMFVRSNLTLSGPRWDALGLADRFAGGQLC